MKLLFIFFTVLSVTILNAQEAKPVGRELPKDWEKTAFERFFQKGANQSGSRELKGGSRKGGFRYTEKPFRGMTKGQAREWCVTAWSKMSMKAKKKYFQPAVTKKDPVTKKGAPVTLKVGQSFSINGTRGTIGHLEVIDDKTLRITLNMTSNTGASISSYDIDLE